MRKPLWVVILLLVTPALALSQTETASTNSSTITGCLTRSKHNTYRLVDEKKVTNMVYSKSVQLDSYVGKSVTLVGNKSATPSTDTGTGRPMPHFMVLEVRPASGSCK